MLRAFAVFLLVSLPAGCSDSVDSNGTNDSGAPQGSGGSTSSGSSGAGGSPGTGGAGGGASFAAVQAIFNANCVQCHDASRPPVSEGASYPALPLTADASRGALLGHVSSAGCGPFVTPGNVNASYLVHKVTDAMPCAGDRMPRKAGNIGGPGPPPLSTADVDIIRAWIQAGAP